jgi:hypothetical protein
MTKLALAVAAALLATTARADASRPVVQNPVATVATALVVASPVSSRPVSQIVPPATSSRLAGGGAAVPKYPVRSAGEQRLASCACHGHAASCACSHDGCGPGCRRG